MGQQQMLLLILTITIVGLAVAGGIMVFEESFRRHQGDDVLSRNVRIAQEAVNWRGRSVIHGGGGNGTFDPLSVDGFSKLGVQADFEYTLHAITEASGDVFEVVGISSSHPNIGARVRVQNNEIVLTETRMDGSITLPGGSAEE